MRQTADERRLGTLYNELSKQTSIEIKEQLSESFPFLQKMASRDPRAMAVLGECFSEGCGVQQDETKAFALFLKAAEQGNALAQNNLGVAYGEGCGVEQSDTQAGFWYAKAAEQGDADAQYLLGLMYAMGRGVEQDDTQAVFWYRKSAEQGDEEAKEALERIKAKQVS